ncbi:MAG: CPBP family glutamic-type intramembrane protease [Nitrososphaerales archaeon]
MLPRHGLIVGFAIVVLTMVEMFTIPRAYFVLGSIVSTSCMLLVALLLTKYQSLYAATPKTITIGIVSAVLLYLIFLGGNAAIKAHAPLGVSTPEESSIYSLFASTPLSLKIIVFLLDAVGFESFFRGTLQSFSSQKLGIGSVFLVALIDAAIHVSTFNPLFVITTFIADTAWGINYYYTKDLYSTIGSHFLWDMLVFVLLPIS